MLPKCSSASKAESVYTDLVLDVTSQIDSGPCRI